MKDQFLVCLSYHSFLEEWYIDRAYKIIHRQVLGVRYDNTDGILIKHDVGHNSVEKQFYNNTVIFLEDESLENRQTLPSSRIRIKIPIEDGEATCRQLGAQEW